MSEWSGIRINFYELENISVFTFRKNVKEGFKLLGFPMTIYSTQSPHSDCRLYHKEVVASYVVENLEFRKMIEQGKKVVLRLM